MDPTARLTLPEYPFRLITVRVKVVDEPASRIAFVGSIDM